MAGRAAWVVIVVALAITTAHATPAQDAELAKLQKAAVAYEDARQYAQAEPLELKIIAAITKDKGAQAKDVIEPLYRLAGIYSALQRTDEEEAIWIRVVSAAKQAFGNLSGEHAQYLMRYARMLDARSEYSSAQRVYEQALKTYDGLPKGGHDASMIGVLQALGQLYLRTNQHAKAQPVFDRAIELTLKGKDTRPLFNLNVLWATGTIYWNAGRKDLATPLFARAIAMAKQEIVALEKSSPTSADLVFMHSTLALNVVPFSALVDDKKDFLIKKYTFTYLTSGRDLLRLAVKTRGQGAGVLFADPKFDASGGGGTSRGRRSAALSSLSWPQLPGTAAEADAIGKTYKGLTILRGAKATEGALKRVKGPTVLHLATHGFFLPDDEPDPAQAPPSGGRVRARRGDDAAEGLT